MKTTRHRSRPTARVLAVLELLQTHGRMRGAELADRVDVDGRTLRRYIALLEELGIPITTERGRHGAYMLVSGFKLPPMMFTDDEALALSLGLQAARGLGLAEAETAVASAQAKLERVMPANLKRRVRAVGETVTLDMARAAASENNEALRTLSAAALTRERVQMGYRSATDVTTEREFDTYGLTYRSGRWYALGMCHLRNRVRSFRLDRITYTRTLNVTFARPEEFDTAAHLNDSIARIPRGIEVQVLLRTDLERAHQTFGKAIGVFERVPGGTLLTTSTGAVEWFARELTRADFDFEIRKPRELRDALRAQAVRLARLAIA